jgi:chromosome partitioning protein
MMKIAVANRKGGVGKTTTAVHLAAGLARAGKRVLLVDTDPQGNVARFFEQAIDFTLSDVLEGAEGRPTQVAERLDVIGATPRLAVVAQSALSRPYNPQIILSEKMARFEGYDFVVLDTSPSYSALSVNVFFYAERILVPVSMEALAAEGFNTLKNELEEMAQAGAAAIRHITPTMVDKRKGLTGDMIESLRTYYRELLTPGIRYQARFGELSAERALIYDAEPSAKGAEDYAELTKEVLRAAS